jgi:NitT/TauT family transport system substrate-binding protein
MKIAGIPRRTSLAAAAAAVVATGLLHVSPAAAQDKVSFQLDWIPTGEYAIYYSALDNGFFREQRLDVTINRGQGSGDTIRKVAAGTVEFGVADIATVMTARQRSADSKVKSVMPVYTKPPHSLFVIKGSGVASFKDLEGKRVGTTPGNSHQIYLPFLTAASSFDPAKINWVTTDPGAMGAMLINGQLDAAPFFQTHQYFQNKQAQKNGREIVAIPYANFGLDAYASTIIASDAMIERNPDLVRRFLAALQKSFLWAKANPEAAARLHNKHHPQIDVDDALGSLRIGLTFVFNDVTDRDGLGQFSDSRLRQTYDLVAKTQQLDPALDPKGFVDGRFAPKSGS